MNGKLGALIILFALALAACQGRAGVVLRAGPTTVLLPTETPEPLFMPAATLKPAAAPPTASAPVVSAAPTASSPSVAPIPSIPSTAPAPTPTSGRIMAVGARPSVTLRTLPSAAAPVVAALPGSDVFWAAGRSADGAWLRVAYGENGAAAWAAAGDLALFGDPAQLPVMRDAASQPAARAADSGPAAGAPVATLTLAGAALVDQLRVRAGPAADQPVVAGLAAGQAISITGRSRDGEWLAIRWPPGASPGVAVAWVAARYVVFQAPGRVEDLPIVAGPSGNAAPSVPSSSGKIAFQTRSGGDIYVVDASGSGLRRVATGAIDPALAPDGARLAYARWADPSPGIYVLDLAAGEERRVAAAAEARGPAWSPDGSRLAFARAEGGRNCISTPFGCIDDATAQAIFRGQNCLTTPYGRFCLSNYPRVEQTLTRLTQVTLAGGRLDDLPSQSPVQSPTWRPDGAQIVYRGSRGLQVLDGGSDLRLLVDDATVRSPAWSPGTGGGGRIAVQVRVHDHEDIFLLDASGGGRAALTRREPLSERVVNNVSPTWSPDGTQILFLTDRDGPWRLYVMNADGSNQRPFLPAVLGGITFNYDYAAERMVSWSR